MSKTGEISDLDDDMVEDDVVENAMAICNCLEYLQRETQRLELPYAAHLIGLALEAIVDNVASVEDEKAGELVSAPGAASSGRPH